MPTPSAPSSPTESQVYAAYQSVFDEANEACEGTDDTEAVAFFNDVAQAVSEVLTEENEVDIEANTAAFKALTPQMKTANDALKKLKDQEAAITAKIATAGKVFSAIDGVLQLTGKFL
jgi:hypothetical protein